MTSWRLATDTAGFDADRDQQLLADYFSGPLRSATSTSQSSVGEALAVVGITLVRDSRSLWPARVRNSAQRPAGFTKNSAVSPTATTADQKAPRPTDDDCDDLVFAGSCRAGNWGNPGMHASGRFMVARAGPSGAAGRHL